MISLPVQAFTPVRAGTAAGRTTTRTSAKVSRRVTVVDLHNGRQLKLSQVTGTTSGSNLERVTSVKVSRSSMFCYCGYSEIVHCSR